MYAGVNAAIVLVTDPNQGFGFCDGEILQEDGVHKREDRSVRTDAECEGKYNGDGEARCFPQLTKCIPKILEQDPHEDLRAHDRVPIIKHVRCHKIRKPSCLPAITWRSKRQ